MAGLGTATSARRTDRVGMRRWLIVVVLFLVQMANYADKTVVSLAATQIMSEFNLGTEQYGMIGGAFFSLYAVTGLIVAFAIAPRFKPRKILTILLICWTLVQLPIFFAASFPMLIVCRTLLGMGEGAGTPTALNAAHEWFEDKARSMPSAIILFGATAGSMIAAPVLTSVIQAFGWRSAFLSCAIYGAVVLLLWLLVSCEPPHVIEDKSAPTLMPSQPDVPDAGLGRRLWRDPTLIGVTLVGWCAYWLVAFQVSWLAPFFVQVTHDAQDAAWFLSLTFALQAVCILGMSYVSQMLLNRGYSSRIARGVALGLAMAGSALCLGSVPLIGSPTATIMLTVLAFSFYGVATPIYASIISEVTPLRERNRVMTVILSLVTLAAIPSSIATGFVVALLGWSAALVMNGAVAMIGAAACFFLIHPAKSAASLGA